jgi:predicted transcriptional regulator
MRKITTQSKPVRIEYLIPKWYHSHVAFTLRTDKELEKALTRLSKELGTSRQEVVRQAVLSMDEQVKRNAKFNAALEETLETWSELIERLANT